MPFSSMNQVNETLKPSNHQNVITFTHVAQIRVAKKSRLLKVIDIFTFMKNCMT